MEFRKASLLGAVLIASGSAWADGGGLYGGCSQGLGREAFAVGAATELASETPVDSEFLADSDRVCFSRGAAHARAVVSQSSNPCRPSLQSGFRLGLTGAHYTGASGHRECHRLGWEWGRARLSWDVRFNRRAPSVCRSRYRAGWRDAQRATRTYRDHSTNAMASLCYRLGYLDGEVGDDFSCRDRQGNPTRCE